MLMCPGSCDGIQVERPTTAQGRQSTFWPGRKMCIKMYPGLPSSLHRISYIGGAPLPRSLCGWSSGANVYVVPCLVCLHVMQKRTSPRTSLESSLERVRTRHQKKYGQMCKMWNGELNVQCMLALHDQNFERRSLMMGARSLIFPTRWGSGTVLGFESHNLCPS